jgi:hypothetical protein
LFALSTGGDPVGFRRAIADGDFSAWTISSAIVVL